MPNHERNPLLQHVAACCLLPRAALYTEHVAALTETLVAV
jgi:hypothetical protein